MIGTSPLFVTCHWIARMAWLNVIWLILVMIGAGFFGVIPASVVVGIAITRYLSGSQRIRFSEAWVEFKKIFIRSNQLAFLLCLPLTSAIWYINWIINNGSNVVVVVSLSIIPIIFFVITWLFFCVIQMSLHGNSRIKDIMLKGLVLVFAEKKVVLIFLILSTLMMAISLLSPVVFLFFGPIPVFTCVISCVWYKNLTR